MPRISVVIPVYNRETTIKRSVDSVLNQTVKDIEVIIVDDASVDGTAEILDKYSDPRIRVFRNHTNLGAAECRNIGIKQATGYYIAFQDSDDVWKPNKLELQLAFLKTVRAEVCSTAFIKHGYNDGTNGICPDSDISTGMLDYRTVLRGGIIAMPTVVANRAVLLKYGFDRDLKWCEDYEWSIRIAKSHPIAFLNEPLVDVYLQPNSVTIVNVDKQISFFRKMVNEYTFLEVEQPWFFAELLSGYAKALICTGRDGKKYYLDAFKCNQRPIYLLKYSLAVLGLINHFFH